MSDLQLVARFGRPPSWLADLPDDDTSVMQAGAAAWRAAVDAYAAVQAELERVADDGNFTPLGKANKARSVAEAALGALKAARSKFGGPLTAARDKLAAHEAKLAKDASDPLDAVLGQLRQAELRALLPTDPLEVRGVFSNALSRGDAPLVEAILALPELHPGHPGSEAMTEMAAKAGSVLAPVSPELARLMTAADDVTAAFDTAEAEIKLAGGVTEPDKLRLVTDEAVEAPERDTVRELAEGAA